MEAIDESRVFGRNRIYFGRMTALSLDEITKRTKIFIIMRSVTPLIITA